MRKALSLDRESSTKWSLVQIEVQCEVELQEKIDRALEERFERMTNNIAK